MGHDGDAGNGSGGREGKGKGKDREQEGEWDMGKGRRDESLRELLSMRNEWKRMKNRVHGRIWTKR